MGLGTLFSRSASRRGRDVGLIGYDKNKGTTGGSFVSRTFTEGSAKLDAPLAALSSLALPGKFEAVFGGYAYTDQYDRTITLSPDEVAGDGSQAADRICSTYEHEALNSVLGRQYSFDHDGSLVFTSEVNNLPMTAILTPGMRAVSIYLPGQQDDTAALNLAQELLPPNPGKVAIRARRAAAESETWEASPRSFRNNQEARERAYARELEVQGQKQKTLLARNPDATQALRRRLDALSSADGSFGHLMPSEFAQYYADTEKKHFDPSQPGSTFTGVGNLEDLLEEAFDQRGTLQGDDREELMALGADPRSFGADKRYLMVRTPGTLGAVSSSELSGDQLLQVVQKSADMPPVCALEVNEQPASQFATIVLTDSPSNPAVAGSPGMLITAFPGVSMEPGASSLFTPFIGQSITVAEGRKIFGREFSVNTQVG